MDRELKLGLEAYRMMYETPELIQEEGEMVDENRRMSRDPEGRISGHSKQPDPSKPGFTGIGNMSIDQIAKMSARIDKDKEKTKKEEVDIFDTILDYLVSEGYADTNENALVIMSNMSEEWRQSIVEGMTMKDFKANRKKLQRKEASDDAKKRGHVDKFTGKPYGTEEAASRRRNLNPAERESRRKFAEDPD